MFLIRCFVVCILYVYLAESFNLTLLHNNDLHSHFAQVNAWSGTCDNSSLAKGQCFGGFARIIAKVKEIKDSQKTKVLFLNAGDNFQGTVWYSLYKWKVVAEFIKMIQFDAITIGNHEFDDGVDGFAPFVDAIAPHLPIVSCNIDASNEPKLNNKFHKSVVLEVDNHKIGVIGYTTPETTFLANPGNTLTFNDEIESIKKEVELLKKQGIKILIGLGHSGLVKDVEIAQKVPELDVIVGGHSHSFLYSGPKPSVEEIVDKYPVVVNHGSHITLVVQAFAFSKYLGRLDLEFNENGDIYRYDGKPILLDQKMPEDAIAAKVVAEYEIKIKEKYGDVIGKTNVLLEGGIKCLMGECNLGNLITDAMVEFYMRKGQKQTQGWTDSSIAVYNGGGIRSTIDERSKNGSITLEDILSVIPFGNDIVILVMSGKVVKDMLEHSVTKYDVTGKAPNGRFLQVSGLRVYFDLNKPELQRVTEVYVRCANCRAPEYKPLNETQTYRVIAPKYLAEGGDEYTVLQKDVQRINYQDLDYQIVSDYIKEKSPISQGYENRLNLKYNNLVF